MKPKTKSLLLILSVLILAILACGPPASTDRSTSPQAPTEVAESDSTDGQFADADPTSEIEADAPTLEPTATLENTATQPPDPPATKPLPTATQPPPTDEPKPQCVVLQNLNFRPGPGTAYSNRIGSVLENTVVFPTAFYPVGVPGGSWVLVHVDNQDGWIAAGADFIYCNFDLASLPSVDVDPPPPPAFPKSAKGSVLELAGNCDEALELHNLKCEVVLSDESFIQFKLFDPNGKEITENSGIEQVAFKVFEGTKGDTFAYLQREPFYQTVESTSAYCIFGGNGPCNNWPFEGNTYVWPNGIPVISGNYYFALVEVTYDVDMANNIGEEGVVWGANFQITLP